MLEGKIEEIKRNKEKTEKNNVDINIDLKLNAYLPDNFFLNESDKLNFYREIESLDDEKDLDNLIEDFKKINNDFPSEVINLFDMLRLKIRASIFYISSIKRV
jgi:transcription-repair coupling factor (superfamily II helicase)